MTDREVRTTGAAGEPVVVGDACIEDLRGLARVKRWLTRDLGLSEGALQDCRLALSEAVANAFQHGQQQGQPYCRVVVLLEPELLRIAVEDHGSGLRPDGLPPHVADPDEEHGRGMHLIRMLMDGVSIFSTPQGTSVEMVKRLESHRH